MKKRNVYWSGFCLDIRERGKASGHGMGPVELSLADLASQLENQHLVVFLNIYGQESQEKN